MAEPKKRTNNSKQGMRRMHDKVIGLSVVFCEKCHEPKQKHKLCYNCGSYKGKTIIELGKKEKIPVSEEK